MGYTESGQIVQYKLSCVLFTFVVGDSKVVLNAHQLLAQARYVQGVERPC